MDVGVITIHNHHNYGAVLQAFALNHTIRKLGHDCKTIDCNLDPEKGRRFQWTRYPGALLPNLYIAWHKRAGKRHDRRFRDFIRNKIPLTDVRYDSLKQMTEVPPCFEVYIAGSDQIWRPSMLNKEIGDAYHLSFASPERSRLVAYAPSFGVSEIPDSYKQRITRYLMRYHALSARETRGRELIKELTGKEVEQVLDPTLLLNADDYNQILRPPSMSGEYLLLYPMELGHDLGFFKLVKQVKKYLSLPVVCVLPLQFSYQWLLVADKIILDAGPREFLGLFQNASFVCSNSFHGTVFSIIYRKNFIGFPHSESNIRITSLLEKIGLMDRQVPDHNPAKIKQILDYPIDYDLVTPRLKYHVDHSHGYLERSLS